jgi:hypothetical protein
MASNPRAASARPAMRRRSQPTSNIEGSIPQTPAHAGRGPKPIPLSDVVFTMTMKTHISAELVLRVSRLAEVSFDDVTAGRYPAPGTCPHCGHVADTVSDSARC